MGDGWCSIQVQRVVLRPNVLLGLRYTMPCHTIPYHTIHHANHTMACHTIPYHTTPHHTIPHHTILYHTIPYHTIPYHTIPYHTIPRWRCWCRRCYYCSWPYREVAALLLLLLQLILFLLLALLALPRTTIVPSSALIPKPTPTPCRLRRRKPSRCLWFREGRRLPLPEGVVGRLCGERFYPTVMFFGRWKAISLIPRCLRLSLPRSFCGTGWKGCPSTPCRRRSNGGWRNAEEQGEKEDMMRRNGWGRRTRKNLGESKQPWHEVGGVGV